MNATTTSAPSARRRLQGLWLAGSPVVRDGLGAVLLMLLSLLPLGIDGLRLGELQYPVPSWVTLVLAAGQTLPLALRRTMPAVALALIGVAFGTAQALGAHTGLAGLGLLFALYACGAHLRRRFAVIAASLVGYIVLVAVLIARDSPERPIDWVTFAIVLSLPWLAGEAARRWRAEQTARLERAATAADRAARSFLARELHDLVTHHVTAMVMQAESAPYLENTPGSAVDKDAIFATIGSTGRLALTELRSLLDTLDPVPASQQALGSHNDVADMVRRLRETGYPISLRLAGPIDEIPPDITAVMRSVAREAVTNALKHARGKEVQIVIEVTSTFELTVTNKIASGSVPTAVGRGTSGMRDRVTDAGGFFTAEIKTDRYTVVARWDRE